LKILHVTPHYEPAFELGGIVRSISQLCRELARLNIDVTVFTTNNNRYENFRHYPLNQETVVNGVKVWFFDTKLFNRKFLYSPELGRACYEKMQQFDILHLTSFWCYPGIPAGKAARNSGIPYILSPRGTLVPYCLNNGWLKKKFYLNLFEKKNISAASAVHYTTELERETTHGHNRLINPSFVVPNPVDIENLTSLPSKEEARKYLDLPQDAKVISFVGRLNRRKALDVLVQSFAGVAPQLDNNCCLLMAGHDDGYGIRLQKLVKKKGLANKVRFMGFVDAKKRGFILRASDLFWFATYPGENFGHAAVEAMAAGIPVLFSENVGISEDAVQNEAGIVVNLNPDEIVKKVMGLLSDKEKLNSISMNAQQLIFKYDATKITPLMLTAYEDVLRGSRSPELRWR